MFLKHTKLTQFSALQLQNNSYYLKYNIIIFNILKTHILKIYLKILIFSVRDKRAKILFTLKM